VLKSKVEHVQLCGTCRLRFRAEPVAWRFLRADPPSQVAEIFVKNKSGGPRNPALN
jgi:hypothetical protein